MVLLCRNCLQSSHCVKALLLLLFLFNTGPVDFQFRWPSAIQSSLLHNGHLAASLKLCQMDVGRPPLTTHDFCDNQNSQTSVGDEKRTKLLFENDLSLSPLFLIPGFSHLPCISVHCYLCVSDLCSMDFGFMFICYGSGWLARSHTTNEAGALRWNLGALCGNHRISD